MLVTMAIRASGAVVARIGRTAADEYAVRRSEGQHWNGVTHDLWEES